VFRLIVKHQGQKTTAPFSIRLLLHKLRHHQLGATPCLRDLEQNYCAIRSTCACVYAVQIGWSRSFKLLWDSCRGCCRDLFLPDIL